MAISNYANLKASIGDFLNRLVRAVLICRSINENRDLLVDSFLVINFFLYPFAPLVTYKLPKHQKGSKPHIFLQVL